MQVNINRVLLQGALQTLKPYTGPGKDFAFDKYVSLETFEDNGKPKLKVMAANMMDYCEVTIDATAITPGLCPLMEFNRFKSMIDSLDAPIIDIDSNDLQYPNQVLLYWPGNAQPITLLGMDPTAFPKFPEIIPTTSMWIPFDLLKQGVETAGSIITQDESYPLYNCVNISVNPKTILFESVDSKGRRMVVYELEHNLQTLTVGSFFADCSRLNKLIALNATAGSVVNIQIADNGIVFYVDTFKICTRIVTGNFPNCVKLIPATTISAMSFDRLDMMAVLERVKILADDKTKSCKIKITATINDPIQLDVIEISAESAYGSIKEYVTHQNFTGKNLELSFKIDALYDGLRKINDSIVCWLFPNVNTAIYTNVNQSKGVKHHYLTPAVRTAVPVPAKNVLPE